jgi:hypothetical protein
MTLGPATKAAISQIVATVPYLHADAAAIPSQHRDFWQGIQSKYAANHQSQSGRDPKVDAAEAHITEVLEKALAEDNKSEAKPEDSQPAGPTDPLPNPVIGDHSQVSDDELDRMTAPHPAEDVKEGE